MKKGYRPNGRRPFSVQLEAYTKLESKATFDTIACNGHQERKIHKRFALFYLALRQ
jgi:hypothetical protein